MKPGRDIIERARRLSQENPDSIVAVYSTNEERCVWASPSHLAILGYTQAEMPGHHWGDFIDPLDQSHAGLAGSDALLTGQSVEIGLRVVTKTGATRSIRGRAWIVPDPATMTPFLFFKAGVVHDQ